MIIETFKVYPQTEDIVNSQYWCYHEHVRFATKFGNDFLQMASPYSAIISMDVKPVLLEELRKL
jgi:hypothetical protein